MLSGSQLAGGLGQIPYLLASVLLQPALKRHQVSPATQATVIWVVAIKISNKLVSLSEPVCVSLFRNSV